MESIPTPPHEEHMRPQPKRPSTSSKPVKTVHRGTKRPHPSHHGHPPSPMHESASAIADARHKRVWKACERCRMKKTKCDGEFPCGRCKIDGLVCTAGTRKKTEYKQLPRGYAEVLENTQFALIATVHKLYAMVRNHQEWDLGDPELNERGQPIIHNIASKLGCIRPNSDVDLPVHSVFPEDEAGMAELARQLEEQQAHDARLSSSSSSSAGAAGVHADTDSQGTGTDRASSTELDHSDFEHDYRRAVFGGANAHAVSPQRMPYEFEAPPDAHHHFRGRSPAVPQAAFPSWASRPASMDFSSGLPYVPATGPAYVDVDLLNQGLLESSFGTIKPHVLSCPNPEVMMGIGDPMIYSGYDAEMLRL